MCVCVCVCVCVVHIRGNMVKPNLSFSRIKDFKGL